MTGAAGPGGGAPAAGRWLIGGLLLLTFLLGYYELWDSDFWWHLRTGQLIWERGAVPRTDWFTYTSPDAPWIDLHWGYQLVIAALYAAGGIALVVFAKAATGTATVAVVLTARRREHPVALVVTLWIPAVIVLSARLYDRPEIVSVLFLAAFLAILHRAGEHPRLLWLLPLVEVLWVNMHALFAIGPAVLALAWLDRGVSALAPRSRLLCPPGGPSARELPARRLAGPTAAVAAACFLNPYVARGALFPLVLLGRLGDPFYRTTISELQGTGTWLGQVGLFANVYTAAIALLAALAAASVVLLAVQGRRLSVFRVLLLAAFGYLGWESKRSVGLYALVFGAVTAWNAGDFWALARGGRNEPTAGRAKAARLAVGVALALLCATIPGNDFYRFAREDRAFGGGEQRDWFAHGAARFLARPGMPARGVAFDLGECAVYLFHAGPSHKVFVDPRLEVNPRPVLERYFGMTEAVRGGQAGWEERFFGTVDVEQWPAVLVGTATARPLAGPMLRNPRWRPVYADSAGIAFLPVPVAERLGLPAVTGTSGSAGSEP